MNKYVITGILLLIVLSFLIPSTLKAAYDEPYRPQFHYSPLKGWMNDVNGVWYYKGVYHLSHQSYPHGLEWANMHWKHAVSTDMLHWEDKGVMFEPDVNVPGACFSGSTVIDFNNTSGFQTGTEPVLVTIYTATSKGTCLAYSNDLGDSWIAYSGNPVAVGAHNETTRDPKVFWYAPDNKWVLALYQNGTTFYTSPDLKTWTLASNINFGYECPDMFELPVDDGETKKWVLMDAISNYHIGSFDGTRFTPEHASPYRMVNNSGIGAGFYASQTFFAPNFPGNRLVQMGWMSGLGPGNTSPWTHNSSFPCELNLKTFEEGIRVTRNPIEEISSLYESTTHWENKTLNSNQNLFAGVLSKTFDLEVELDMTGSKANTIHFQIANRNFEYKIATGEILGSSIKPINGKVKIRLLADWGELEMFGNDGQVSYAENFKFTTGDGFVSMTANGELKVVSARFSKLKRCWAGNANNKYIDDSESSNFYSANWTALNNEKPYLNGSLHLSNIAGSSVSYSFNGTQVAWYGLKNNDLGMAAIYIDNQLVADNIDCYSTERMVEQLFSIDGLQAGDHTIKMLVKGTKNPTSANNYIVHDYFASNEGYKSVTAADDSDSKTIYIGSWLEDQNDMYYSRTAHISNSTEAGVQYEFNGSRVYWYGIKDSDLGMASVYIDGNLVADNIDCYSPERSSGMLFSSVNLSSTNHTILVEAKGIKNRESSGIAIIHDYFDFPVKPSLLIDDRDSLTKYTGQNWILAADPIYNNGNCHVATTTGSYFSLNFTGSSIDWYGLKNDDLGFASVFIDDKLTSIIDCYSTNRAVNKLFSTNNLLSGNHVIKIVTKGQKNASSKGIALVHDYFKLPDLCSIDLFGNLSFGELNQNSSKSLVLTITNPSNSPLLITGMILPDGYTTDWDGGEVAVGSAQSVNINFSPAEIRDYSGFIRIMSNADSGTDSIAVSGVGIPGNTALQSAISNAFFYPNPVGESLNILLESDCQLKLINPNADILIDCNLSAGKHNISLASCLSGLYLLSLTDHRGQTFTHKIVKN